MNFKDLKSIKINGIELKKLSIDGVQQWSYKYKVNLTAIPQNGGVTKGSGEYDVDTNVSISAIPAFLYEFKKWNDETIDNPRTITVSSDVYLSAFFEREEGTAYFKPNY